MNSLAIAALVMFSALGGGLAGLAMGVRLGDHHRDSDSRDVVKLVMGLIASLTALVLGLLISSAHSSFDAQSAEVRQLGIHIVQLDRALMRFGDDGMEARAMLRSTVEADLHRAWPKDGSAPTTSATAQAQKATEGMFDKIANFVPKTEAQRFAQARALQLLSTMNDTRRLLGEQARGSLSWPFIVVMVFWLTILFFGFGLFARFNAIVVVAMFVGTLSVAGAMFLILEMDRPYTGVMQISEAPIRDALGQLGK